MDEGLEDVKVRVCEILPADGVEWCEAPESATQSWVVVGGGVSTRVLKEFISDCWSQPELVHGDQLAGAGGWYGAYCCCCPGMYPGAV
jgi:1,6-anhydro-N-acetylmuramate kinase